jgi:hypothetical protein
MRATVTRRTRRRRFRAVGAAAGLALPALTLPAVAGPAHAVLTAGDVASAATVPVSAPTFETPSVPLNASVAGAPSGWWGFTQLTHAGPAQYSRLGTAATVGTMSGPGVLTLPFGQTGPAVHVTTSRIQRGLTYTLTVAVGRRDRGGTTYAGAEIALLAGDRTVATASTAVGQPAAGTFGDLTVTWTATAAEAGLRLGVSVGPKDGAGSRDLVDVDNVRLTSRGTAAAPTTLVVEATPGRVVQRSAGGTANVSVNFTVPAGTVRGPTTPWARTTVTGSTYLTIIGVPTGWYDLQVAATGAVSRTVTVPRIGVGEVFVTAGQSNAANNGQTPQRLTDPRAAAPTRGFAGWQVGNDPQPNATNVHGSPWPAFADSLVASNDVPVGIVAVAYSGTSVASWAPNGIVYQRLRDVLRVLGVNGFRAVLWHQGEADSARCTSRAAYVAAMEALVRQLRTDAGRTVPWVTATAARAPGATTTCINAVRSAQAQVRTDLAAVYRGPDTDLYYAAGLVFDGVHFTSAGLTRHGREWATAVRTAALVPAGR